MLPGSSGINVYWICNGTPNDDIIESTLTSHAHQLRHELSQLRVLGHVPPICFVKDQRYFKMAEVERRLAIADYGEDFVPTDATHDQKVAAFKQQLSGNVNAKIDELFKLDAITTQSNEAEVEIADENYEELPDLGLPPMRHDILGVDTLKIYDMVSVFFG